MCYQERQKIMVPSVNPVLAQFDKLLALFALVHYPFLQAEAGATAFKNTALKNETKIFPPKVFI